MYQVLLTKRARKQLERIPEPDYSRIKKCMYDLAQNPRPAGCKKMKGRESYRIRQGDYCILYEIHDHVLMFNILAAGHRKDIYE